MRIRILRSNDLGINAINEASERLSEALSKRGHDCCLSTWPPERPTTFAEVMRDADLLVVPYNPFMWGRWGFAPRLVWDVLRVRRSRCRPKLGLIIHEPYVPIIGVKSLFMGVWQRFQLIALILLADHRFASIERWAARFDRIRPTSHLPSGSNVPDMRVERDPAREALGASDAFVVAILSTGHESHLRAYVEAAVAALANREPSEVVFLRLGAGAPDVHAPEGVRVVAPGRLPLAELGRLVAAADLLLVPFSDGVSTRRGSLMAGFCEGVCILGTLGDNTDQILSLGGLELVAVGHSNAFAQRAVDLAHDTKRRSEGATKGRELFEAAFTWDVIARKFEGRALAQRVPNL